MNVLRQVAGQDGVVTALRCLLARNSGVSLQDKNTKQGASSGAFVGSMRKKLQSPKDAARLEGFGLGQACSNDSEFRQKKWGAAANSKSAG